MPYLLEGYNSLKHKAHFLSQMQFRGLHNYNLASSIVTCLECLNLPWYLIVSKMQLCKIDQMTDLGGNTMQLIMIHTEKL